VLPDTPLAKEVFNYWQLYPDAILLMRVGKFYEVRALFLLQALALLTSHQSYFEPAISFANTLSLKLAYKQYSNGVYPFSGFPVTQLDKYLKILAEDLGRAVVVVEEYDEEGRREALNPIKKYTSAAGDLKDRRVGRVVTPGTLVEDSWLSGNESRYLLALAIGLENGADTEVSLAYTDASTGEFFLKDTTAEYLEDELVRIAPREAVLDAQLKAVWQAAEKQSSGACREVLETLRVLGVHVSFADPYTAPSIEGLAQHSPPNRSANLDVVAVAILRHHLQYALRDLTPDLTEPDRRSTRDTMLIDAATISALEIRHAIRPGGLPGVRGGDFGSSSLLSTRGTLLSTMAKTQTPGGHRLLIRTLTAPSTNIAIINRRLDMVETLVQNQELRLELRDMLHPLMDVMRLVQRFRGRRGDGRDAWETARWIKAINQVRERIRQESVLLPDSIKPLMEFAERLRPLEDLVAVIEGAIDEVALNKGYMDDPEVEEMLEAANEVEMDAEIADAKAKGSRKVSKKEMEERRKVDAEAAKWWMQPE
jgi:DNA mismatch repair ATPase MutS